MLSDIPQKRIEPHSRTCAEAVVRLLKSALIDRQAADRSLAALARENRQLGSRDRRIISETLFAVLRWWGWLRHLVPESFATAVQTHQPLQEELNSEDFYAALAASWLLDGRTELPPSTRWWMEHAGVRTTELVAPGPKSEIHERRRCLRAFFAKEDALPPMAITDLIPNWAMQEASPPYDWSVLVDWLQARPPVWMRAQTNDLDRVIGQLADAGVKVQRHERLKHAIKAHFIGVNLRTLPLYRDGYLEVQDVGSQAVAHVCAPKAGEQWWDCCAGAGGKTLHLSWLMGGKGTILATDSRVYKLEDLKKRARRAARSNIRCKEWLGIDVPRYHGIFHGVLVDAPCTCSGTWRRNPDARWTTKPEDLDELAALQTTLLNNASVGVASGGTLVYATCSMFQRENQAIVTQFLATHPDFALTPFDSPLTGKPCDGMLQIWPWDSDCDSMFIARMTRRA